MRVLESQTKAELLELHHGGIGPQVPDEWMMQKMKTAAAKKRGAAKVSPPSRRAPASARPGSAAMRPPPGDSPKQPTGSPGDQQTAASHAEQQRGLCRSVSQRTKRRPAAMGGKLRDQPRQLNAGTGSPSRNQPVSPAEPSASDRRWWKDLPSRTQEHIGCRFNCRERRELSPTPSRGCTCARPGPASDVQDEHGTSTATPPV